MKDVVFVWGGWKLKANDLVVIIKVRISVERRSSYNWFIHALEDFKRVKVKREREVEINCVRCW